MNRKPKSDLEPIMPDLNPNGYAQDHPKADEYITETRSYKLITPLFGGGVEAGVNDPITPIRASGIRGQLRFWWRAIRGGGYGSIEDLRSKEAEIWGSATTANNTDNQYLVNIHIEQIKNISRQNYRNYPGYIAFPLREPNGSLLKEGLEFSLKITYASKHQKEIQAALWAWEMFGGVGGRTRRGFGSITQCDSDNKPQNAESVAQWLKQNINNYTKDISIRGFNWIDNIPNVVESINEGEFFCSKQGLKDLSIWNDMINMLQKFRHQRKHEFFFDKNNRRIKKYKRNHWPEPDFIRRITGKRSNDHRVAIIKVDKFPRAAFGLPIIFHFINRKDESNPKAPRDPYDTTLVPKGFERFSSPLIIKIIQCADKRYVGIALILSKTQVPNQLQLKKDGTPVRHHESQIEDFQHILTPDEAEKIKEVIDNTESGVLLNQQTDILKAFLAYLAKELR